MQIKQTKIHDLTINYRKNTSDELLFKSSFDKDIYFPGIKPFFTPRQGSRYLDIGADIGTFSLQALLLSPNGTVYVLEPDPESYQILLSNIKINKLSEQIFPFNFAISNRDSVVKLFQNAKDGNWSNSVTKKVGNNFFLVKTISLDKLLQSIGYPKIDFCKVNCEGGEFMLFTNISKRTIRTISCYLILVHYDMIANSRKRLQHIKKTLCHNGFIYYQKHEYGDRCWLIAKRTFFPYLPFVVGETINFLLKQLHQLKYHLTG